MNEICPDSQYLYIFSLYSIAFIAIVIIVLLFVVLTLYSICFHCSYCFTVCCVIILLSLHFFGIVLLFVQNCIKFIKVKHL